MTDANQIARGILQEHWLSSHQYLKPKKKLYNLIAAALREYGEAEYLRGVQHHFSTCDEREKQADAAGYRRGVEEERKRRNKDE